MSEIFLVVYVAPDTKPTYEVPVGIFSTEMNAVAAIHDDWQELETDPRDYHIKPFTLDERTSPDGKHR